MKKNWLALLILITAFVACEKDKDSTPEVIDLDIAKNVSASKGQFNEKIEVKWSPVPNVNNYQIYRSDASQDNFKLVKETNDTIYLDNLSLKPYTNYYYKIKSYNSEYEFSNFSEVATGFVLKKIDRPIEVSASKGKFGNKIHLSWANIPNIKGYHVYRFDEKLKDYVLISETNSTSYTDTSGFQPLTKYYYKIKSYNSQYEYSSFSDVTYGYVTGKTYDLHTQFGSEGSANGQFKFPEHLAIDLENNIYVSDPNLNRIQKFSNNGKFNEIFYSTPSPRGCVFLNDGRIIVAKSGSNKISILNNNKEIVKEWGESGTGDGQFNYFRQICIDDEQNVYVVDHNNDRVQKFDLEGNFKLKWGSSSESPSNGTFKNPWGITYFKNYILVSSQNMIQFFNKNGEFIKQIDLGIKCYDITHDGSYIYIACGSYVLKTDESTEILEKIGEGNFSLVSSVAVDSDGKLYAVDVYNRKVSVYVKN